MRQVNLFNLNPSSRIYRSRQERNLKRRYNSQTTSFKVKCFNSVVRLWAWKAGDQAHGPLRCRRNGSTLSSGPGEGLGMQAWGPSALQELEGLGPLWERKENIYEWAESVRTHQVYDGARWILSESFPGLVKYLLGQSQWGNLLELHWMFEKFIWGNKQERRDENTLENKNDKKRHLSYQILKACYKSIIRYWWGKENRWQSRRPGILGVPIWQVHQK